MKTSIIISIIILLLAQGSIVSQSYIPFPENDAYWTVLEFDYTSSEYVVVMYTIKGDTIFNEKQYNKIFQLTRDSLSSDTIWTLHCLSRQDVENKKMYFIKLYQGETQEKLGYSLDVNLGDTLSLPAFDYANIGDSLFIVEQPAFDSTLLWNGEKRKNYFFTSILQYGSFDLQIIEGVGGWKSPFPNLYFWDPFHQSEMNCLVSESVYLYGFTADPYENCGFDLLNIYKTIIEPKIFIYPNPAKDYVIFEFDVQSSEFKVVGNKEIRIIDAMGQQVALLDINNEKVVWDTQNINPGVYFYSIELNGVVEAGKLIISK